MGPDQSLGVWCDCRDTSRARALSDSIRARVALSYWTIRGGTVIRSR
jgi:hypothetical protein